MEEKELRPDEKSKRNMLAKIKPYVYKKIMNYKQKIEKGESIAIIQFQYDYTCNFRCDHCSIKRFQGERNKRFFTISDVKELARQADEMGLAQIVITGGEPLIFPDFDDIVAAIDPEKFYVVSDTNGWFLDDKRAKHLKSIGVDKIQLSIDSLNPDEHDSFRKMPGAHKRAMRALDAALNAGLYIIVQTVVTHQRLYSDEFEKFIQFMNQKGVGVFVTYAKPVGAWEGKFDMLVTPKDMEYMENVLEKKYNVFTHITPSYGLDLGCIAVKRMISITKYGDVMPCPYMHYSLGNFFKEPLKTIVERGLKIKQFRNIIHSCPIAVDIDFINKYEKKIYGKPLPVPIEKVFNNEEDYISPEDYIEVMNRIK